MPAAFILFTTDGERVPSFTDRYNTPDPDNRAKQYGVTKHGWKTVRSWKPGFFVTRAGGNYRVDVIEERNRAVIGGSVYQLRAWDLRPPKGFTLDLRFPNIAAVEMYLRTLYGQSR